LESAILEHTIPQLNENYEKSSKTISVLISLLIRKLYELEGNVLDFLPKDEDIMLYVGDYAEQLLHDRAEKLEKV
jgi:hypothetical protein